MPSYKPLCRWVQWRLPWTCYLHCHRACKLNDLGLHREVWDTSSWCQQVFPARPHSLPLRAPCFPEQLLCDPNLLSKSILASFQMRAEVKGATVDRMFCMHSFSVLFFALPSWLSLFAIEVWQHETVCILVPKPRDGWENNNTFWLIRPLDNSCSHMILGTKCQSDRGNDLIQHLSWCFWDHLSVPFWWFAWCVFQELSRKASLLIRSSC